MRRSLKTTMVAGLLMAGLVLTGSVALADGADDYRSAMKPFLPFVHEWADDAVALVRAAETKPTLACGEEMATIAQRGVWLSQDLTGTGLMAPEAVRDEHDALAGAMDGMVGATLHACDDPAAARATMNAERQDYDAALRQIDIFLNGLHMERPGEVPVGPVTGN